MDEIYQLIEELITASGYPVQVSGFDIYNEICDEIEGKENGTYLFMSKQSNNDIFEYTLTIYDDNFNLSTLSIRTPENKSYLIQFD